jgi:hypothetical protein
MKTIACLLLFAGALSADFCVCGGCFKDREAPGVCATCKGASPSIDDKTCRECARKASACMHCGKKLRNPKLLVGEAVLVDKQPRADVTYRVVKSEDGSTQGVYFDEKRVSLVAGRVMLFAAEDAKGDLVVREQCVLAPKEKDLEVKGESDGPVHWRTWNLTGPAVAPKDGKYVLVLPAWPEYDFDVVAGEKVLARHRFKDGAWKELR